MEYGITVARITCPVCGIKLTGGGMGWTERESARDCLEKLKRHNNTLLCQRANKIQKIQNKNKN